MRKKLTRLEQLRISQAKLRRNRKITLKRLIENHSSLGIEYNLSLHNHSGQLSIEEYRKSSLQG